MASVEDKKENEVDLFWSFINGNNDEKNNEKRETQTKQMHTTQTEEETDQKQPQPLQPEEITSNTENNERPKVVKDSERVDVFEFEKAMKRLDDFEAFDARDELSENSETDFVYEKEEKENPLNDYFSGFVNTNGKSVQNQTKGKIPEPSMEGIRKPQKTPKPVEKQEIRKNSEDEEGEYGNDPLFKSLLGDYTQTVSRVLGLVASVFGILTLCVLNKAYRMANSRSQY